MACRISEETLHEYIDGELDELNALVLESYLKTSEECRGKLAEIEALCAELDDWAVSDIEIPMGLEGAGKAAYAEAKGKGFTVSDFFRVQAAAMNGPLIFLDHLPGRKTATKAAKSVSHSLGRVSASLLRRSFKLATSKG